MADNASHNDLIAQFSGVTGVDADRAQFYLESAGWNLDVAMSSFFDDDQPGESADVGTDAPPQQAAQPSPPSRPQQAKPRFGTLSSMAQEEDLDSDEEEGQAFYAGGSERGTGQQVLGPPRKKANAEELVKNMFKSAKEHGAEVVEPGAPSASGSRGPPIFRGMGYRLGETEDDSAQVRGAPLMPQQSQTDVVLKLWRNGFSVDDGPVRDYNDPANKDFLDSIKRGEIPRELIRMARGGEVNLNMEDHREEEYVQPKVTVKAFSGEGHTLGSPAPTVAGAASAPSGDKQAQSEASAKQAVTVDESSPTTNIQIRLADGSRMVAKFNHTHTVGDVRRYITTARPQFAGANFVLMTTFPNKELSEETQTLEEAKLLNAVLVQRLK